MAQSASIIYQQGMSYSEFEELKQEYYESDDDSAEYPVRPYEIKAVNDYLSISNLGCYEDHFGCNIMGNDRMIVLFALAEMMGYDLIKKGT